MSTQPDPARPAGDANVPLTPRRRQMVFAEQEMRLISALVVLLGTGLFLALPFVLSIGSVVFLPLVTAIVLTIILSPLADKLASIGLPNFLASFVALLVFLTVVGLALAAVLSPAVKTKLASLTPAPSVPATPAQAAPAPAMDPGDIARLLQAHLQRVGCNPGSIDGTWDDDSRKAMALFNKNAHTNFDVKVASLDALDGVRSKPDRVCPLICAKGQRADGDHCVQINCGRGHFLNSEGACEKRAEPAPKPHTAHRETPAPRRAAGGGGGHGGKCFSFNGKTYCE